MATFRTAAQAVVYDAPHHHGVLTRRLQGLEAGPSTAYWVGRSDYQPGGGVDWSEARGESTYISLAGRLTVAVDGAEYMLEPGDSLHLDKGELRSLRNDGDSTVSIIVVIAP